MQTYRVGLLGFGFIGKVHAYGYDTLPYYCDPVPRVRRITHVVTGRAETAEKARRLSRRRGGDDRLPPRHRDPEVDIVHICTPNHLHKDALLSAMRAPEAHLLRQAAGGHAGTRPSEIRAALAGYRGTAQMTFQNRFFPATMRAKQLIDEGALGEVLEFRAVYLHGGSADPDGAAEVEAHGRGRRRRDRRPGLARARPGRTARRPVSRA